MRKENKNLGCSVLPPRLLAFWLHCLRASSVARILKRPIVWNLKLSESHNCGWTFEWRIHLVKEIFPDDSEELLVSDEHEEDVNGEFWESDEEEF